jgi:hypothetical protein
LMAAGVGDAEATAMSAAMVSVLVLYSYNNNMFNCILFVVLTIHTIAFIANKDMGDTRRLRNDRGSFIQLCRLATF